MIGGITRRIVLLCLVYAVLAAGSSRIYAKDLRRNPRDASCSSCSRDRPDGLANWSSPPKESRETSYSSSWSGSISQPLNSVQSSPLQPQSLQYPTPQLQSLQPPPLQLQSVQYQPPQPQSVQFQPPQPQSVQYQPPQPQSVQFQPPQPQSLQYPSPQPQSLQPAPLQPQSLQYPSPQPQSLQFPSPQPQSLQYPSPQPQSLQFPPLQAPLPQLPQPASSFSFNPPNQYRGTTGGRFGPGIIKSWSTSRRENPVSFGSRDLNPDLASAPASPVYSVNPPISPVAPVQPFASVIRTSETIPIRRPDVYSLSRSQSTQLNQASVDFAPIQTAPVYNTAKPKLSVVFRADQFNDDSSEEDHVPLYPSDYPRKLIGGGPDNVYPSDFPRGLSLQAPAYGGSQDNAPSFPVDYTRKVVVGERQDSGNLATVQSSRAEVIVKPQRELRVINGAGYSTSQPRGYRMAEKYEQPEIDQTQDTGMVQSLAQSQKNQPRESRMVGSFEQPQYQYRDTLTPSEDNYRPSSIMQVPEATFEDSQMQILKAIQQIGVMFANNRSSSVDPQKDQGTTQQGIQLAKKTIENDQVHESKVSPGPGEIKEKRDVADGERVPAVTNDMLEVSSLEEILPGTTPKIADMAKLETMD